MKTTYMKLAILNLFSPSVLATDNLQNHCFFELKKKQFSFWRYLASKKMAGVPQLEEKLTE